MVQVPGSSNNHKIPKKVKNPAGPYFASYFIIGGARFDTFVPEAFLSNNHNP